MVGNSQKTVQNANKWDKKHTAWGNVEQTAVKWAGKKVQNARNHLKTKAGH